jgi:hypothetical protein
LGFDGAGLNSGGAVLRGTKSSLGYLLRRVVYDEDLQSLAVRHVLVSTLALLRKHTAGLKVEDASRFIDECVSATRANAMAFYVGFKHPGFEEEKEWRIVFPFSGPSGARDGILSFRATATHLIPFLEIHVLNRGGPQAEALPLKSVRLGPTSEPALAKAAVGKLLGRYSYPSLEVLRSSIPLR